MNRHRRLVWIALALAAVASVCVVIPAYLLKPFVDEGMRSGNEPVTWKIPWIVFEEGSYLRWHLTEKVLLQNVSPNYLLVVLTLVAFFSVLFKSVATYFSGLAAAAFSNRAVRSVRVDLYKKFVSLPPAFYHRRKSGELVARSTADLTVLQSNIASVLLGLIEHPLTALVFMTYLFVMNLKLTLVVFVVAPLILGLSRLFARKVKKHSMRVQDATAEVTSAYQETLLCLRLVQGFNAETREAGRFRALAHELYRRVMACTRWQLGLGPMMDSAVFLVLPAVLIVGKVYFHHTLGELMSMVYAFSRAYSPIKRLVQVNNNLKTLQGATQRVFELLATEPEIRDAPDARNLPRHHQSIEFRGVWFGYQPGEPILKDISFQVRAGEMVAFVGSTGAGKSTLLNLIPRFYDVTQGAILIDGVDIREVTLASLRGQMGIVNQDTLLFHDTILENLRYGSPGKGAEEIAEAARAAHAHDFIMAQPQGYQTVIGDQGAMLSGGQRQRIALARALLADPAILILDEAASALDSESERLVQATIEGLRGRLTILMVAHRLSTVMNADRIFVMEGGRIVESGASRDLLALNGRFRRLHDIQFGRGGSG